MTLESLPGVRTQQYKIRAKTGEICKNLLMQYANQTLFVNSIKGIVYPKISFHTCMALQNTKEEF